MAYLYRYNNLLRTPRNDSIHMTAIHNNNCTP